MLKCFPSLIALHPPGPTILRRNGASWIGCKIELKTRSCSYHRVRVCRRSILFCTIAMLRGSVSQTSSFSPCSIAFHKRPSKTNAINFWCPSPERDNDSAPFCPDMSYGATFGAYQITRMHSFKDEKNNCHLFFSFMLSSISYVLSK